MGLLAGLDGQEVDDLGEPDNGRGRGLQPPAVVGHQRVDSNIGGRQPGDHHTARRGAAAEATPILDDHHVEAPVLDVGQQRPQPLSTPRSGPTTSA